MILSCCFLLLASSPLVFSDGLGLEKRYATVSLFQCRAPLYYNCGQTINCIHSLYVCDGEVDCPLFGDDERDCIDYPCPENTLKCSDTGQCIRHSLVCNGCMDCPNGDDERECPSREMRCTGNQFYCRSQNMCMPVVWACDGLKGQCEGDADENCDISETEEIFLSPESPETFVTFNMTKPEGNTTADELPILLRSWKVTASKGFYLYAKPVSVGLGSVCGPSIVEISEGGQKAAHLCGDSFPPWRTGHIAAHDRENGSYLIQLKLFNDFGAEEYRSLSLHLWQSIL